MWCAASGTDLIKMYCEGKSMGRFQIPSTPPTINKTIRFPSDVVEEVEKAIQSRNCTFSAFVIAAVRMALEDLNDADASCPDRHP